ncbi:isochorismatase family protein [Streptomyces sp. NPDC003691]
MPVSPTLRQIFGVDESLPRLADATLVLIDVQHTYRTGVLALEGAEEALTALAELLAAARAAGAHVVHVVQDGGPGSPYDLGGESGAICPEVAPRDGEPVVVKQRPDSFHETELEKVLRGLDAGPELVLAGFMTHMCVAFTAQGAAHHGYRPTVVAEATATRALAAPDGTPLSAAALQTAALTTIGDLYGRVVPRVADLTRG